MEDFKHVRENLLEMLEGLDERLEKITDNVKPLDEPIANDFPQSAIKSENNGPEESLVNATRNEMEKIQQAISRIDEGTYGVCLSCGQTIIKVHLSDTPFSSYCSHCAEKKEG